MVLLQRKSVEREGDWEVPELLEEALCQEDEEWGEHGHFCDICQTNWLHDNSPECYGGGPARCPEHEEGE